MPRAKDVCDEWHTNTVHVRQVEKMMPDSAALQQVVEIFAALSVPTRARILFALSRTELCVCDLAALLGMTMSAISHQLRLLRRLGLVKYRKAGRLVYYSLDDEHASGILTQVLEHVQHGRPHAAGILQSRRKTYAPHAARVRRPSSAPSQTMAVKSARKISR